MKKIEMVFYKTNPVEKNTGLKFVLWAVTDTDGNINHDWGFADWVGSEWDAMEVPEGYTAKVEYWANTVNPELLLKEPSKIITL